MVNQIDISPRKKQLKEEYERLQLEYAALVAERDEMQNSEGPRLTALYMEALLWEDTDWMGAKGTESDYLPSDGCRQGFLL